MALALSQTLANDNATDGLDGDQNNRHDKQKRQQFSHHEPNISEIVPNLEDTEPIA